MPGPRSRLKRAVHPGEILKSVLRRSICESGENVRLVATWAETIKTSTLSLKLRSMGFKAADHDGFLEVDATQSDLAPDRGRFH